MTIEPPPTEPVPGHDGLGEPVDLMDPDFDRQMWARLCADHEFQAVLADINQQILHSALGSAVDYSWAYNFATQFTSELSPEAACLQASFSLGAPPWDPLLASAAGAGIPTMGAIPTTSALLNTITGGSSWTPPMWAPIPGSVASEAASWVARMLTAKSARDQSRTTILCALRRALRRRPRIQVHGLTALLTGTRNRLREAVLQAAVMLRLRQRAWRSRSHCDPPGHAATARPKLTRGPDTCRSITTPRSPAGLTPA